MGKPTFFDNVREWGACVTFAIYLHAIRMTKEEFWAEQDRQAIDHLVNSQPVKNERRKGNMKIIGTRKCEECGKELSLPSVVYGDDDFFSKFAHLKCYLAIQKSM